MTTFHLHKLLCGCKVVLWYYALCSEQIYYSLWRWQITNSLQLYLE